MTANTAENGLLLIASNNASNGNQRHSPFVFWEGQAWKSNSTAESQPMRYRAGVYGIQGTSAATQEWRLERSTNGGAWNSVMTSSGSGMSFIGLVSANDFSASNTSYIGWGGTCRMVSGTNSIIQFRNSVGNDFNRLQLGGSTSSYPSIQRSSASIRIRLADDSADATLYARRFNPEQAVLAYAASIELDFDTAEANTVALTGNVTFTTANLAAGRRIRVYITCDATPRNFTFPGWKFVGAAAPASIAASKTAILELDSTGTTDGAVIARYFVEP